MSGRCGQLRTIPLEVQLSDLVRLDLVEAEPFEPRRCTVSAQRPKTCPSDQEPASGLMRYGQSAARTLAGRFRAR